MIKRTMYFYDKAQMRVINNLNNKLHKQRGVNVFDADIDDIDKIRRSFLSVMDGLDKTVEYLQYADRVNDEDKRIEYLKKASTYANEVNKKLPMCMSMLNKVVK